MSSASRIPPKRTEHVVLVDVDALNLSYLESAPTPHIDALASRGCLAVARGVFKSFSNPARYSLVTGAWPEVHQNQAYYYDRERDVVVTQERPYQDPAALPLRAETIAQALASEGRTVAGVEYPNLRGHGIDVGDPKHLYVTAGGDCGDRVDAAIDLLSGRAVDSGGTPVTMPGVPSLLAVYLKDVDDLGHAEGPDSANMPATIETIDRQIGRLAQACADVGIADRTVVMLVTDHGMVHIAEPILPDLLAELEQTSLSWEVVPFGGRPAPTTEIVIVATSRNAELNLRGEAASTDGVRRITEAARRLGERVLVHDAPALARLGATSRIGDIVVEAVSPYHLSADTERPAGGGHGGSVEMNAPFVIGGPAIRPGAVPRDPRLIDLAPTISALLGTRPPADAQGRVLEEIVVDPDGASVDIA